MNALNPSMLVIARECRAYTQEQLCRSLGIAQGTISKIEHGQLDPAPELVERIGRELGYPTSFFFERWDHRNLPVTFYRKRAAARAKNVKQIAARVNVLRMRAAKLLAAANIPECRIRPLNVIDFHGGAPSIAAEMRIAWDIPSGPIDNMIRLVESLGVLVIRCDFGLDEMDAISVYREEDQIPPVIFINSTAPGDRLRFNVAHELGHLLMHAHLTLPPDSAEDEANAFASAFLMPSEIRALIPSRGIALSQLAALKLQWKVSMGAIIMRGADLGRVTESQKRSLFIQLGRAGFRKSEPYPIPREEPTLIKELIEFHLRDLGYSHDQLSAALVSSTAEFRSDFLGRSLGVVQLQASQQE